MAIYVARLKMKHLSCLLIFITIFSSIESTYAWRETGHYTVAELAWRKLTPQAQAKFIKFLKPNETLATVSTWPDDVRKTTKWKHTAAYHFGDFEDQHTYFTNPCKADGDVVRALVKYEDVLRNNRSSFEDRVNALKFLVHFMGDLHQPLHIGRPKDQGGNLINVRWYGKSVNEEGEKINLHKIWDLHLIDKILKDEKINDGTTYNHLAYANYLEKLKVPANTTADLNFADWAMESHSQRKIAYAIGNGSLGDAYYFKAKDLLNTRIIQAGLRLGKVLNSIAAGVPLTQSMKNLRQRISCPI